MRACVCVCVFVYVCVCVHVCAYVAVVCFVRVCDRLTAHAGSAEPADPPRWTFDMGREISGHVRLALPAGVPPGTNFTLRHAEVLSHPPLPIQVGSVTTKQISQYDGSAYMGNLFWALPVDVFRSSSSSSSSPVKESAEEAAPQVYEARFTYVRSAAPSLPFICPSASCLSWW